MALHLPLVERIIRSKEWLVRSLKSSVRSKERVRREVERTVRSP